MKKIFYILLTFCLFLSWACTKERGYERELEGTWSVSKYDVVLDSSNIDIAAIEGNKVELYFNSNNGFVVFFEHLDSTVLVVDTLLGTSSAFIGNDFSTLVMTYHEIDKGLAAQFISEEPIPNEKFNTELYSILHLNKDSLSLEGILDGSSSVNRILLQGVRK